MTIKGYIVLDQDFNPIVMDLSDDIMGGLVVNDPIPLFGSMQEAIDCAESHLSRYADAQSHSRYKVAFVTVQFDANTAEEFELNWDEE